MLIRARALDRDNTVPAGIHDAGNISSISVGPVITNFSVSS